MNIEKIAEPIRVLAAFAGGRIEPLRFVWGGRTYKVCRVNGRWLDRQDDGYSLHYSVQACPQGQGRLAMSRSAAAEGETYYIHFSSKDVQWWIDQVITE